ncbi:mCG66900 [Mus musculus]|nr:mCG66900 [Mus musculus]
MRLLSAGSHLYWGSWNSSPLRGKGQVIVHQRHVQ